MQFSFCSVASAQLIKVIVGNNAISGNALPAWMAKEAGIFIKNGLDVQLVYFRGGTITAMALVARETPISQVSGPPIVSAVLKGADAVVIAGGNVVSEYWLMSRPEIKTAEQLKGGYRQLWRPSRFYFSHRVTETRADSDEGCRHRAGRHSSGASKRLAVRKSSSRYA